MITFELVQRIWSLIPPPASDGSLEIRELDMVETPFGHPLLTVDADNHRHLLIPPGQGKIIEDKQSAGVQLTGSIWGEAGQQNHFVDLVCLKPHLNSVFDLIVFDILTDLTAASGQPDHVCLRVLNRWREMLASTPSSLPDKNTFVGLYGELTVLRRLARYSPSCLNIWTGPEQGRYDFFSDGRAIEVKTSMKRHGIELIIHGHDQLEPPHDGRLFLNMIKLEETPNQGENISNLIESLAHLGVNKANLYKKLSRVGFTPDIIAQLEDSRFTVAEERTYIVNDNFPRITSDSFVQGSLPRGVISLTYKVDLSVPPPFPLEINDAEMVFSAMVKGTQ